MAISILYVGHDISLTFADVAFSHLICLSDVLRTLLAVFFWTKEYLIV